MFYRKPPKTTKEAVFEILSKKYPLRAKQLYGRIKKEYRLGVTYQAVHFSLVEMQREGILIKEEKEYVLNPTWVKNTAEHFNSLYENYVRERRLLEKKEKEEVTFSTPLACWQFFMQGLSTGYFGEAKQCYVQVGRLFAAPMPSETIEQLRVFCAKTNVTVMCRSNGIIEKFVANYLRTIGMIVHLGIPCAIPTNTLLVGECVISVHMLYTEADDSAINKVSYSLKSLLSADIISFYSGLINKKIRVKAIINRNPDVYRDVHVQTTRLLKT